MLFSTVQLLLLASIPSALAQSVIDFSQLPSCAAQCSTLLVAQQLCVPPSAPASSQTTYDTCFCHSNYLADLYTSTSNICSSTCPQQAQQQQIEKWYVSFCSNINAVGAAPATATVVTTSTNGAVATLTTATATATTGTATATPGTLTADDSDNNGSWWHQHARWIAMAIVLVVGFAIIIVVGVLWKKRYNQRRNRAGSPSNAVFWDPSTNPHFNNSIRPYTSNQEKNLGRASVNSPMIPPSRPGKVKKMFGRG